LCLFILFCVSGCCKIFGMFCFKKAFHSSRVINKISCYSSQSSTHGSKLQVYYPKASDPSSKQLTNLQDFVDGCNKLLVISGAGLSTESGIPDYRSKDVGLYDRVKHRPMQHQDFIKNETGRRKYWARNYIGWDKFVTLQPNSGHQKLAYWDKCGKLQWHVTQNVDGLCHKAGSRKLTELHGSMHRVVCMKCKTLSSRSDLQTQFSKLNSAWSAQILGYGPDADAFLKDEDVINFELPECLHCGGNLKPDVIFFGDSVPLATVDHVYEHVNQSDGVLVVGSSLHVWSSYRFVLHASQKFTPIVAINVGPTRADDLVELKIDSLCSKVLSSIH